MTRILTEPRGAGTLWLGRVVPLTNCLRLSFGVDDHAFSTSIWYDDVDFGLVRRRFGERFFETLLFHIAAFEAAKLYSLRPARFDAGPYSSFVTADFERLWNTILLRAWGDWRYKHSSPDARLPVMKVAASACVDPVTVHDGPTEVLSLCGGGKDSLLALRLLERSSVPYASLAYSHSIYGQADMQHRLIDDLLDTATPRRRHKQWVIEDFLDCPIPQLRPDLHVHELAAAETPASFFALLPIVLTHGYRYVLVGHERSADRGNLIWEVTGEEVNHQWGKSLEAETLLQRYAQRNLVENLTYSSLLKPLSDTIIFNALERHDPGIARTHSCNVRKPWCEQCPKCAYVWLGYQAYLPEDVAGCMFRSNLFDLEVNQLWFRQLLGLEAHTPFECVGGVTESRLMFEVCRRKGISGKAIDAFVEVDLPLPSGREVEDLLTVRCENRSFSKVLLSRVGSSLVEAGSTARRRLRPLIGDLLGDSSTHGRHERAASNAA